MNSLRPFSLFSLCLVALVSAPAFAQGGAKPADPGAEKAKEKAKQITADIAEMKKLVAAKTKDADAIGVIDKLLTAFPEAAAPEKKAIAESIAKNLTVERPPIGPNEEQHKIYQTSVVALGAMGEHGSKPLMTAYEMKEWKHDAKFRGKILTAIGATKDAGSVEFLIKQLNDKDDSIVADTSATFGNFSSAKLDVRKIVEKLVNLLNSSQSQAADPSTPTGKVAKDRYEKISPAITDSLQKLTNQNLRQPIEWQKWWNTNKEKNWT